jgi:hypothetical protein
MISPDGERVAFVTKDWKSKKLTIWSLNSDGTGLRNQLLDLPEVDWVDFVGWKMSGKSIIISIISKRGTQGSNNRLLSFDPETGNYEILAENLRRPYSARISPGRDSVAFVFYDEKGSQNVLAKVDLKSLEREEIYRGKSIDGFCFSQEGDKIAFMADVGKLGIYSLAGKKVEAMKELKPEKQPSPLHSLAWVTGGKKFVFGDYCSGEPCLRVFGEDLKQEKTIKIPFSPEQAEMTSVKNYVFVSNIMTKRLWTVDINTENWRKVY